MASKNQKAKITIEEKRAKIRRRYQNATTEGLEVISATPKVDFYVDTRTMRVAIYVRVSTDDIAQTSSYEIQRKYFSDMVERHPNWILADIYADEGISGTSLNKRKAFNQMIADCREGKIDLIVTKNISRWSRNVVDGLKILRDLEDMKPPIGVYFEYENIYSLDPEKKVLLSFQSIIGEQESRSKSAAVNAAIEMRNSHGLFLTPPLLGYDNDEDGNLIINYEEAETVKLMYFMYLSGYSSSAIAKKLQSLGRKTKLGNLKWSAGTVIEVLKNERHCGDILARKTWTPNFLNHKSVKNRGEQNQYRKRNHHEAIVSRDDYIAVQQMIANAKYGGNTYLPKLKVTSEGALRGFVSVNPNWGGFTAEDYKSASASLTES